jgi:hypothetical protein
MGLLPPHHYRSHSPAIQQRSVCPGNVAVSPRCCGSLKGPPLSSTSPTRGGLEAPPSLLLGCHPAGLLSTATLSQLPRSRELFIMRRGCAHLEASLSLSAVIDSIGNDVLAHVDVSKEAFEDGGVGAQDQHDGAEGAQLIVEDAGLGDAFGPEGDLRAAAAHVRRPWHPCRCGRP